MFTATTSITYTWIYADPCLGIWTVGYYLADGTWEPVSDHDSMEEAAAECRQLNDPE